MRCHPHTNTWQQKNWPSDIWIIFEVPHIRIYLLLKKEKPMEALSMREHFFLRKLRDIFLRFMKLKYEHIPTLLIKFPTSITSNRVYGWRQLEQISSSAGFISFLCYLTSYIRSIFQFQHAANINMANVAVLKKSWFRYAVKMTGRQILNLHIGFYTNSLLCRNMKIVLTARKFEDVG